MKYSLFSFLLFLCTCLQAQPAPQVFTSDIDHFWEAYDSLQITKGSFERLQVLERLFFKRGTEGLKLIMDARRYSQQEYLDAIDRYPEFWRTIRPNTMQAKTVAQNLGASINKLRRVYPELKPAPVYFTVGALRSPGTALKGRLLVGTELAFADKTTANTEFTEKLKHLPGYFATEPRTQVEFLNIHEYVHTQQNTTGGYDLLSQCVFEGVAEFIPTVALGTPSATPAVAYGKQNMLQVRSAFERELFTPWVYRWVWNSDDNEFKIRDLGYYIGYAMAEAHYTKAKDKQLAIKQLIELDYANPVAVERFVDQTGYLSKSCKKLRKRFEKSRPKVAGITQFKNGSKSVAASLNQITVRFSEPIDPAFRSTDYGPLGKEFLPEIKGAKVAPDGLSITYEVAIQAGRHYQMVVDEGFRNAKAIPLQKYLVEFWTK